MAVVLVGLVVECGVVSLLGSGAVLEDEMMWFEVADRLAWCSRSVVELEMACSLVSVEV